MSKQSKRDRQRENRELRRMYQQQLVRRRRTMRVASWLLVIAIPLAGVGIWQLTKTDPQSPAAAAGCREIEKAPKPKGVSFEQPELVVNATESEYVATVQTNCGSFTIALDIAEAPGTVNSFVFLAQKGFYDDLLVHRVQKDFVIQGGDPAGDGTGGPGYTLADEPPSDGYQLGSVAMANSGPNTTGSQFFVVTSEEGAGALNQQVNEQGEFSYSILGQVTEGIETIRKINKLGSSNADPAKQKPKAIVVITRITVDEVVPEG